MTEFEMMIDPGAAHDAWVREHEWHLALIPDVIDVIVESTLPHIPVSRGGSRFDKDQITGGGYFDSIPLAQFDYVGHGHYVYNGAAADARELWAELVDYYTAAVQAVLRPSRPHPAIPTTPDADPLSARSTALVTVGWLIDHGTQIAEAPILTKEPGDLYAMIRHMRARYGVFNHPRHTKPTLCTVCAETTVRTWWATSADGRARSIEVRTCSTCGDEHREDERKSE